jgi:hypothetical protein
LSENVSELKYLGMLITNQNIIQKEIKTRFNSGNAFYHSAEMLLSSCLLSRNVKIRIHKIIVFPVVLYRLETWSLILREEHRLRVFENMVLRRMRGEMTGGWRMLHNEELHNLHPSPSIIRIIKSRRMRWAGGVVTPMGEKRNSCRLLVGKPEGKRPLGRPRQVDG